MRTVIIFIDYLMAMKRRMIVNTTTTDIDESKDFYERLGFKVVQVGESNYAIDQSVIIRISTDSKGRLGLSLYSDDWSDSVDKLKTLTAVKECGNYILTSDTTGTHIKLEDLIKDWPMIDSQSILGNYAGISLESVEFERCTHVWDALGFAHQSGSADQGWISLAQENYGAISIMKANMCPHMFSNPGLTYFNGTNNKNIIELVRQREVPLAEELTVFSPDNSVDNVIIKDPGGLMFFLFND